MDGHTSFGWCITHGIAISACPCPKPWAPAPAVDVPAVERQELKPGGPCVMCRTLTVSDDVELAWPSGRVFCLRCYENEVENRPRVPRSLIDEIEMDEKAHQLVCLARQVNG